MGIPLQQADAAHNHAGRAVSALEGAGVDEGLLHGMQAAVFLEAFDGGDGLPDGGADGNLAGAARLSAEQHGAGTALAFSATVLAASKAEFIAQNVQQRSFRMVMNGIAFTVYFDFDCGWHGAPC